MNKDIMRNDIMFNKILWLVFLSEIILCALSYIFDWTITRNGFQFILVMCSVLLSGLVIGKYLTLKEVNE